MDTVKVYCIYDPTYGMAVGPIFDLPITIGAAPKVSDAELNSVVLLYNEIVLGILISLCGSGVWMT
jgi:hypothetical protein